MSREEYEKLARELEVWRIVFFHRNNKLSKLMKDVAIRRRKNFVMKNFWESESTKEKKVECLEFS